MLKTIPGVLIHCPSNAVAEVSSEESVKVSSDSLIAGGQLLVSRLPQGDDRVSVTVQLEAGENTELSEDGDKILSRCHGYLRLTVTKGNDHSLICASLIPLVEVSSNKMEAWMNVFPPPSEQNHPTVEMVLQVLEQQGVVYGVDRHALEKVLKKNTEDDQPTLGHLIARGKAPNNGKDAYIRFEVEIGPLPGKVLADGSIDFRERLMFVGVQKDQLLACKVSATKGYPGTNLAGEHLDAVDGKDVTVKTSEDVYYSEVDGTIRATASGVLSVVGEDTIRVSQKQQIPGDVDFSTGNIRSNHSVDIAGSVLPGFMVSAKGNVAIGGTIQSASVNSHGNILIKGGVIGKKSQIRVQGDADIHHIENGLLVAGGNIVIRSGAYYSSVKAGGNIHCPENVKIVGGDIVASGSLSCGQLGSSTAELMNIAVGVDPHRYGRYRILQQEYHNVLEERQNWFLRHGRVGKVPEIMKERELQLREMESELCNLNLIPDTPEDSLGDRMFSHTHAFITVHGGITSGNTIRIGNEIMVVEQDLTGCCLKMDQKSGEITVGFL